MSGFGSANASRPAPTGSFGAPPPGTAPLFGSFGQSTASQTASTNPFGVRPAASASTSNRPGLSFGGSGSHAGQPPAAFNLFAPLDQRSTNTKNTTSFGSAPPPASRPSVLRRQSEAPNFGNSTISIVVGAVGDGDADETETFSIHEALARQESAFIDAIFRNGWKENEERVIRLPEHEPQHFRIFVNFIYTRFIFSSKSGEEIQGKPELDPEWERLARAYALGSYLQATDFKDAITDAIIEKVKKSGKTAPQTMHQTIYPNSPAGSGIRKLLVHIAASRWPLEFLKSQRIAPEWADFFLDVAVYHQQHQEQGVALLSSPLTCPYHCHSVSLDPNQSACYKTKYRFGC